MVQTDAVLGYLRRHGSITAAEAWLNLGCTRLAARIHQLRAAGYPIETTRISKLGTDGHKVSFARYIWGGE